MEFYAIDCAWFASFADEPRIGPWRGNRPTIASMRKYNYNYGVTELRFEWDERKNSSNQSKHGISFEEAARVFLIRSELRHRARSWTESSAGKPLGRSGAGFRCWLFTQFGKTGARISL
jgi:uncharacterized DUF497 family protein